MTNEKDEATPATTVPAVRWWDCPKCPWKGDDAAWRAFDGASSALCPECGAEVEPSKTLDTLVYPPAEKGGAR